MRLAIDFARGHDLSTVRSGGHSFAAYGTCEGGMLIDLSLMKRVKIDPVIGLHHTQTPVRYGGVLARLRNE